MTSGWASALATSLVGEPISLPETAADARAVLAALAQQGWPSPRLVALAQARSDAEEVWPFPVPREVVAAGPAQWYALVGEARMVLGLDGVVQPQPTRTALTADERRLLSDVPPHW